MYVYSLSKSKDFKEYVGKSILEIPLDVLCKLYRRTVESSNPNVSSSDIHKQLEIIISLKQRGVI